MRTNRYINSFVAFIVTTMMLMILSCRKEEVEPVTISLNENVISLVKGTSQTLIPTVEPAASASEIIWSSSNTNVAIVNAKGLVQAVDVGKAVINAKVGNSTSFCDVIVTNEIVPVREVYLNKTSLEMRIGDVEQLLADLRPHEATNRRKRWSSSDESVVSVHEINGTVTAHALGQAVITVKTLDGNLTASCTIDVLREINLLTPSADRIELSPTEIGKSVNFSWKNMEGIDKYILKISTSELFGEDNIVYTSETTETNLDISEYTLNEVAKKIEGNSVVLYWSVVSGTEGIRVLPETRELNLTPDRRDYLQLSPGSESGMQLQKLQGGYYYSLTANGQATVNTVGLVKNVHADLATVVFQYKSNQALPSMTVNFKKPNGTTAGSITQPVTASAEWKEIRFQQAELPGDWGKAGDYIQLDFGNISDYQMQLNAIHLQEGLYIPEILSVNSYNNNLEMIKHDDNYFKFKVIARDPVIILNSFTQKLPSKAVLLSFEYKSDKVADHCQVFLLPLRPDLNYPNTWGAAIPINTGNWKEHTVDMTAMRNAHQWWGQPGNGLRIDPGAEATIGMTMEIRNIQVKYKN